VKSLDAYLVVGADQLPCGRDAADRLGMGEEGNDGQGHGPELSGRDHLASPKMESGCVGRINAEAAPGESSWLVYFRPKCGLAGRVHGITLA
jgi:hypothetical protein